MPIPDTLARKITADFRAEKKYGGRKKFCDALLQEQEVGQDHMLLPHVEERILKVLVIKEVFEGFKA